MANYECVVRTNYFRVTDEERYNVLFKRLCGECRIEDFSKEVDGILYHGFGSYGDISYQNDDEGEDFPDYEMDNFYEEIQKILPEKEAFMYFEVGNEKLRYVSGVAVVCTKDNIEYLDLSHLAINKAKELLNDDSFTTEVDY